MPRTDSQNLALRAWASAHFRKQQAADRLRLLLAHPHIRPVERRLANRALDAKDPAQVAAELAQLERDLAQRTAQKAAVAKAYPLLRQAA